METISYICVTQKSASPDKLCSDHASLCCQDADELEFLVRIVKPQTFCALNCIVTVKLHRLAV